MSKVRYKALKKIEKPIIFSTPMVKAILEGRKSQTRRVSDRTKPRYRVGDKLWVKETYVDLGNDIILYKADWTAKEVQDSGKVPSWKSGRFMFKRFARLWLEVTAVRAEQLNSISEEDCMREGCPQIEASTGLRLQWFIALWDSINGKQRKRWVDNPWCWAYTFEVMV